MNLKTWFKGLGVFVLSSLITAAATMTLDPASFNFSKAGLEKVGLAALDRHKGGVAVLEAVTIARKPDQFHQLEQDQQRIDIVRDCFRYGAVFRLCEFLGANHIHVIGGEQSAD